MNSTETNHSLSRRQYWGFVLLVIVLAAVVTAWFTRPLLSQITTNIPGREGDALEHLWTIWWFEEALNRLGQLPSTIDIIFYPASLSHPILLAGFWARTMSVIIASKTNLVIAYNSHLFLSYVLTWLFMSLLCLELTGSREAALVGGVIFTFFVNRTMHVFYGHWTIALAYPVPLLILTLWRLLKRPSFLRTVAFSMALIISSTVDLPPLAQFAFPVLTAVLIFFLITQRKQMQFTAVIKQLALGFGLAALVLIPVMWPLIKSVFINSLDWYEGPGVVTFSVDLLSPFIPPPGHLLTEIWSGLQVFSEKIYSFDTSITESVVYIGWPTIILAVIGVWAYGNKIQDINLWFLLVLLLFIFALGPVLRIGGELIYIAGKRLMLPYYLLMKTPLFSWGRTPARFYFAIMFALAILAAYGVKYLLSKSWLKRWPIGLTAVIIVVILYDSRFFNQWPMIDLAVPEYYAEIAADTRPVAVLDIPILDYGAAQYHMLYQMTHKHSLVGGHNYRFPPDVLQNMTEVETLATIEDPSEQLAQMGIGYVILHKRFLNQEEIEEYSLNLTKTLGEPSFQDDQIIVFKVPNALEIAPLPLP